MDPFTGMKLTPQEAREYGDYFDNAKSKKSRIGYFYHPDIGCYQYGHTHPMKPLRIKITDTLIGVYQLKTKLFPLLSPLRCYDAGLLVKKYDIDPTLFHSDEYIDFLRQASALHSLPEQIVEMQSYDSDVEGNHSYCSGGDSDNSELSFSSIMSGPSKLRQDKELEEREASLAEARNVITEDLGPGEETKLQQRMPGESELEKQSEMTSKRETKRKRDEFLGVPNDLESEEVSWRSGRPGGLGESEDNMVRFNFGEDCPIFEGLYDFCRLYSTGSVLAARSLNCGESDIAINWAGGLHHAKKNEASGFCYINDCVLGILELLKRFERVLYLDIDIHHGDGVQEAFYTTPRVLTCSLHKFGDYFPGTGCLADVGISEGQNYSLNLPLNQGIDDDSYRDVFIPLIDGIFSSYAPQAVVMQCGVDSVSGDRLGCFNLSVRGHGACVKHLKSKGIPMMVLGGGGYTLRNVPRCWVYETGLLLNQEIETDIPSNPYSCYFAPLEQIHLPTSNMENMNSKQFLHDSLSTLNTFLKNVRPVTVDRTNYPNQGNEFNDMDDDEQISAIRL